MRKTDGWWMLRLAQRRMVTPPPCTLHTPHVPQTPARAVLGQACSADQAKHRKVTLGGKGGARWG